MRSQFGAMVAPRSLGGGWTSHLRVLVGSDVVPADSDNPQETVGFLVLFHGHAVAGEVA